MALPMLAEQLTSPGAKARFWRTFAFQPAKLTVSNAAAGSLKRSAGTRARLTRGETPPIGRRGRWRFPSAMPPVHGRLPLA